MKISLIIVFLLLALPVLCRAQTVVVTEPGQFRGVLEENGSLRLEDGRLYHCYRLQTKRGEQWRVAMRPGTGHAALVQLSLQLGSCWDAKELKSHTGMLINRANLSFVSGGGSYVVFATTIGPEYNGGSYTLAFSREPGLATAGFLEAGRELAAHHLPDWVPVSVSTQPSSTELAPGTVFRDCEDACPDMVVVPAGSFMMGSSSDEEGRSTNEGPRREVRFARPFAVGKYEVTFEEYAACVKADACRSVSDGGWGGGRRPVVGVNWFDALDYAGWLSEKTGQTYQLLSEAEWEYAARAGTTTPWNTGSAIVLDDANYLDQFKQPVPVGGYPANAFGLHDMHGNVAEWVLDCLDIGYFGAPADGGAVNRGQCNKRVVRGGGWSTEPVGLRSAQRGHLPPEGIVDGVMKAAGIRVARVL